MQPGAMAAKHENAVRADGSSAMASKVARTGKNLRQYLLDHATG